MEFLTNRIIIEMRRKFYDIALSGNIAVSHVIVFFVPTPFCHEWSVFDVCGGRDTFPCIS